METFKQTITVFAVLKGLELTMEQLHIGDTSLRGNAEAT